MDDQMPQCHWCFCVVLFYSFDVVNSQDLEVITLFTSNWLIFLNCETIIKLKPKNHYTHRSANDHDLIFANLSLILNVYDLVRKSSGNNEVFKYTLRLVRSVIFLWISLLVCKLSILSICSSNIHNLSAHKFVTPSTLEWVSMNQLSVFGI